MVQRLHPHPYLALFNGPDTSATTAMRDGSPVSLQALYLLNNPFVHDQAGRFAGRLSRPSPTLRRGSGWPISEAFGRVPTDDERGRALGFLERYEASLADEGMPTDRRAAEAWAGLARALLASNEFLFVD